MDLDCHQRQKESSCILNHDDVRMRGYDKLICFQYEDIRVGGLSLSERCSTMTIPPGGAGG